MEALKPKSFWQKQEEKFISWLESLTPRQQHISVSSMAYWLRVEHKRRMEGKDA